MIYDFLKSSFIFLSIIALIVAAGVATVRSIDYIEENPYAAKEKIQNLVYFVIFSHLFLLYQGIPLYHLAISLSIQYAFNCFFESYPIIKPEDPKFIYGLIGSLINHFLLIKFFFDKSIGFFSIVLCFIIIWATPFGFFFSMSAAEDNMFIKKAGRPNHKTYVRMAFEALMNIGKKDKN
jgi:Transmembrane adaptor Erv26